MAVEVILTSSTRTTSMTDGLLVAEPRGDDREVSVLAVSYVLYTHHCLPVVPAQHKHSCDFIPLFT